ncbi:MAG: acetylxylan esterase [Planctomycetes bacterium B3_Pla]|nr:MAG: acetylxylan esterase [Planctomycetes bacterium B3_Pla]
MNRLVVCLAVLLLSGNIALSREPKENDSDVNYDESKVPHYDLPPLLVSAEGKAIKTPEEWRNIRRPQILALFGNLIYGRIPEPESPIRTEFEVVKADPKFMGGKATRKDVRIRFSNDKGKAEMLVLVFVPNKVTKPAPAFMKHSFNNTKSRDFDVHSMWPGRLKNGWPLGEFFDRGYAFVAVYQQDLVGHNEVEFLKGIHPLFYKKGQSFPKAREWGVLSAVAWGAMRAMDYLETDDDVDHTRVAIMGHSKMGKATLWTAAQDERFALAISAQSGCAGAALWRRRSGETLDKMVTRFPYWLCRNAWKFVNQEDDLPVDQHMLLACIAPRPVYVHSGVEDTWADGRGEYLSAYHAGEVYRLLGRKGLTSESSPPVGEAIIESDVGYHIRQGGHSIQMYDWQRFLDFADYHLKKKTAE